MEKPGLKSWAFCQCSKTKIVILKNEQRFLPNRID
jgi:hypothetical protein